MANSATDLTDEDAADLQFPKEFLCSASAIKRELDGARRCDTLSVCGSEMSSLSCEVCDIHKAFCSCYKCSNCGSSLRLPFIECAQCENVNICCRCFASGCEFGAHESDHSYRVLKHDFELFEESGWTASEETTLLDVLHTYGYGSWELAAPKLNRPKCEVRQHYDYFYVDKPASELLPRVPGGGVCLRPVVPYRFRVTGVDEPPRLAPHTFEYNAVAGYNAARADFELEYDPGAEELLRKLAAVDLDASSPRYQLLAELQCAVVAAYNHRLLERTRRKQIIRNHGLILARKTMSWLHRYDDTLTRQVTERLLAFMQFYSGITFDYFMEGLHRAAELKRRITRLSEYRKIGISTLVAARVYERVKRTDEEHARNLMHFETQPSFNWKTLVCPVKVSAPTPTRRGPFRPLDIVGLPGFEKLSSKEQALCSKVRLVPQTYLELKELLLTENKKMGYLKLQTARKMLKIDVNKTRKIYDFLIEEGYIMKPPDNR